MNRFLLLLPLALLVACGPSGDADSASGGVTDTPPRVGDVTGRDAEPSVTRNPNEVIRIDPTLVGVATVTDSLDTYDVDLSQMTLILGTDAGDADSSAVYDWLARFAPLDAAGTYDDLGPDVLESEYTSLVTLLFEDGSARSVYLLRQPDGFAVLSQPDGPVWRLAPEAYRQLVPPADALRAR